MSIEYSKFAEKIAIEDIKKDPDFIDFQEKQKKIIKDVYHDNYEKDRHKLIGDLSKESSACSPKNMPKIFPNVLNTHNEDLL